MTSRNWLWWLVLALGGLMGTPRGADGSPADGAPNVIVIMTDDQGWGDLGFHGNPVIRTPHLDRLAESSVRLPYFYVSPVCAPTRASLLTGRYNYRTRAIDTYRGRALLDPTETTLAQRLHTGGYRTGLFGKWHLGDTWPLRPIDRGFDTALVHRGGGIGQPSDPPGGEDKYTNPILFRDGVAETQEGYCTDVYFREGMAWANRAIEARQPFFLCLMTNAPHGPFGDVPPAQYEHHRRNPITADRFPATPGHPLPARLDADLLARVYAMIENIDDNVGRLRGWLDERNIAHQTLVLFLTDNGEATAGYNAGLRSRKGDVYEGGIRSPLFACWPGRLIPGEGPAQPTAHIDLAPTILEACGLPHRDPQFDGRSLWPLLTRQPVDWPERTLFVQSHRGDVPQPEHHFAARSSRWKLVRSSGFGNERPDPSVPWELFDMQADPYETRNVAEQHPEVVAELRRQYTAWFADVSQTRPDNYAPVRLSIGSPHENPTVLTRQDWRGADWRPDDRGHWEIDVVEAGRFDVTVRWAPRGTPVDIELAVAGERRRETVPAGTADLVVKGLALPTGPARVEATVWVGDRPVGVRFVEFLKP
jgi:arylsulfatase/arylsulfatase A